MFRNEMTKHDYSFNRQIKMQTQGGPLDLELTGVIAQFFMSWWESQFKMRINENRLSLRL